MNHKTQQPVLCTYIPSESIDLRGFTAINSKIVYSHFNKPTAQNATIIFLQNSTIKLHLLIKITKFEEKTPSGILLFISKSPYKSHTKVL